MRGIAFYTLLEGPSDRPNVYIVEFRYQRIWIRLVRDSRGRNASKSTAHVSSFIEVDEMRYRNFTLSSQI